jgi:NADH dehydrogenase FAD-containing subunit
VVEAAARVGVDLGLTVRPVLMNRLIRSAINVFNNATIAKIAGNTVTLDRMGDVITLNGVDTVLVCVGSEANLTLGEGLDIPLHTIGDCAGQYGIMEAIKAGVEASRNL